MSLRHRVAVFAVLAAVCCAAAVVTIVSAAETRPEPTARAPQGATSVTRLAREGYYAFRETRTGRDYGRVELVPRDRPDAARTPTGLSCDRVAIAAGRGICLVTDQGIVTRYKALLFDARTFRTLHTLNLPGGPSRARMSSDGRYAAYTVFVAGDGYNSGGFSTRSAIVDVARGHRVADIERFTVLRDGRRIHAVDFNFWGVTFAADPNRFYATLGTGGHTYLIQGDVASRTVRVIHDGVECPSLSPDGTRIAFKQRDEGTDTIRWHPAVLDLGTMQTTVLPERHDVDDQITWLDDRRIAYAVSRTQGETSVTDVYERPADGSGVPTRLLAGAWSPQLVAGTPSAG